MPSENSITTTEPLRGARTNRPLTAREPRPSLRSTTCTAINLATSALPSNPRDRSRVTASTGAHTRGSRPRWVGDACRPRWGHRNQRFVGVRYLGGGGPCPLWDAASKNPPLNGFPLREVERAGGGRQRQG